MGESSESPGPSRWKSFLGLSAHVKDKTIGEIAAVARRYGMLYLEVVAERFWDLPDGGGESRWREIKELLADYGLRPMVHASYVEFNLASINRPLREAALRQSLRCLELASFLEADHLVVHPGNLNLNYPASYLPEARKCLQESLRSLVSEAEAAGVAVALENGWNGDNHPTITSADEHVAFIEAVGSPALKALFDLGHAYTFGGDLAAYLERLGPYLVGIHIHDNAGGRDEHLPLGAGTVGSATVRRCFEAGVPVILEMNSLDDVDLSVAYLEKHLASG